MSATGNPQIRSKFRALLSAGLLISLTACSANNTLGGIFPGPIFARNFPPPGPENYTSGMKDGCKTAISAMAPAKLYGATEGYVFNANLGITDIVYYKAWKDGYNYCKGEQEYFQS